MYIPGFFKNIYKDGESENVCILYKPYAV